MHKRLLGLMIALVGLFAFVMPSQVSAQETFCYIFNFNGGDYSGSLSLEQGSYETDLIFGDSYYIPTLQPDGEYRLGLRYAPFGGFGVYSRVSKATLGVTYPETNETTLLAVQVESFGLKAGWTNDDLGATDKLYFTSYYNGNFANYANYNSPEYSLEYEGNLTVESLSPEGWHNQMYIAIRSASSGARLHTLRMEGLGSSPFGSSNCDFVTSPTSTPTPTLGYPPTSTPTVTATSTATATITNTPTPTNTPGAYDWCVVFNFYENDGGFNAVPIPIINNISNDRANGTYSGSAWVGSLEALEKSGGGQYRSIFGTDINYVYGSNYNWVGYEFAGNYIEGTDGISTALTPILDINIVGVLTDNITPLPSGEFYASRFFGVGSSNQIRIKSYSSAANYSGVGVIGEPASRGVSEIYYLIVYGTGTPPPNVSIGCTLATPTPTPSPTATETATPTTTMTPYPECGFVNSSFLNGDSGWINTGGLVVPGAIELEDTEGVSQDMNIPPGDYKVIIRASGVYTGTGEAEIFVFENLDSLAVSAGSYTNLDFDNSGNSLEFEDDFSLATGGSRTFTFSPALDGSMTAIRIESICIYATGEGADTGNSENAGDSWVCGAINGFLGLAGPLAGQTVVDAIGNIVCQAVEGQGQEGGAFYYTCGETITPPPLSLVEIGNWIIFLAKALLQWFNCVLFPIVQAILGALLSLIGSFFSFLAWLFTDFLGWLLATVANFVSMAAYVIFNFGISFFNGLLQLGLILVRIVSIIQLFFLRALAFLAVIGFTIQSILNAWDSSGTMAVGIQLHDCVARPLESDLCAFYYIAENTILAPPIGWLIIPFLIAIFYVTSGLYLIDIVAKFVSMVKKSGD